MAYIFLDESGVHKPRDHSVFVLVYIEVFNIEKFNNSILEIEKEINIRAFHWAESSWPVKEKFIEKVLRLDFSIKLSVLKNPIHPEKEMERILPHMLSERNIRELVIDGKKSRRYENRLKKILRDKGLSIRKIKTARDESVPGLRVADMAAGLVRAYHDKRDPRLKKYYYRLVKKIVVKVE